MDDSVGQYGSNAIRIWEERDKQSVSDPHLGTMVKSKRDTEPLRAQIPLQKLLSNGEALEALQNYSSLPVLILIVVELELVTEVGKKPVVVVSVPIGILHSRSQLPTLHVRHI